MISGTILVFKEQEKKQNNDETAQSDGGCSEDEKREQKIGRHYMRCDFHKSINRAIN
jgi:hypothetical protein